MVDFHRFTPDLIALRNAQPALHSELVRVFHTHDGNRLIAFHRWLDGAGLDVIRMSLT